MKILFSLFSWWKTPAIIFKKRYFRGGIDLFLFADPHYFRFLIFKFLFLGGFDEKPF